MKPLLHCWAGLYVLLVTRCYHSAASFSFLIFLTTYQTGLHFQLSDCLVLRAKLSPRKENFNKTWPTCYGRGSKELLFLSRTVLVQLKIVSKCDLEHLQNWDSWITGNPHQKSVWQVPLGWRQEPREAHSFSLQVGSGRRMLRALPECFPLPCSQSSVPLFLLLPLGTWQNKRSSHMEWHCVSSLQCYLFLCP